MAKTKAKYKISVQQAQLFQNKILAWYDLHQRILPWRTDSPDPYAVWLSEIMLQQTTVTAVTPYYQRFLQLWPRVENLAAASLEDVMHEWAGLGYYSRARNLHKTAQIIADERGGIFPADVKALKALPGVGDYTSAAIAAIAFGQEAIVIDGNIERIFARYLAIDEEFPKAKALLKQRVAPFFSDFDKQRAGDFAQALMDLGAGVCSPKSPFCEACPVQTGCAALKQNQVLTYPRKAAKKARPSKRGYVYLIQDDQGRLLLERRPERGLLAHTLGFPTSDWVEGAPAHPDFIAEVQETPQSVRHVFTHFDLELTLCTGKVRPKNNYLWHAPHDPVFEGLPSLFNKVYKEFLKTV
jgi:A/G-specific adenine glycosylase